MRSSKAAVTLGIGGVAVLAFLGIRLFWAVRTPARPGEMPQNSIWVPGPAAPLDLSPRGVWLGCWLGQADNVDHCKVTDYQGNVQFDEQFLPANGAAPVALERLHLKQIGTVELWTWVEEDKRNVPIVPLGDGTILVPARDVGVLRGRRAP